ncbi:acetyltransferase [Micromonospora sp. NBC_00389]|uniref:acetyltransferase n=1 Tax=Micromonospora sp. NBC_00389 TaxID=2903586 RepID=UPI002E1E2BA5
MTIDLVIAGAGGIARETAATVAAINAAAPTWRLRGFLDDDPALHGVIRAGLPVLGPLEAIADLPDAAVVVCIANARNPGVREQVVQRLGLPPARYATVVHPSAEVPANCTVGPGSVLLAQVVLTADVTVGAHVAIMPQTVLTHDDVVSEHATIASGVRISGSVRIGRGAYLGAGALIRESLTVGANSVIGMGSVVLRDVPPDQVWAGSPARFLRSVRQPALHGSTPR